MLKEKFGLSNHCVVYAGRIGREKRLEVLVRAIACAKNILPCINLAIVGHGAHRSALERLIRRLGVAPHVKFFGTVSKNELAELFCASEVFATMSTSETQCNALLQAMASGLPAIEGGLSRALKEFIPHQAEFLIEEGNHLMLSERLIKCMRDQSLRLRLGANARVFAEQFAPKRIASMWESCYGQPGQRHWKVGAL